MSVGPRPQYLIGYGLRCGLIRPRASGRARNAVLFSLCQLHSRSRGETTGLSTREGRILSWQIIRCQLYSILVPTWVATFELHAIIRMA
jgi:hypothetical protein